MSRQQFEVKLSDRGIRWRESGIGVHRLIMALLIVVGETDKSDDDAEEETLGRRDDEPMECMASTSAMLPSPIETSSPKTGHRRFPGDLQQQHATHICEVFEDEMHGKALILPLMTFRDVQNALGQSTKRTEPASFREIGKTLYSH